MPRLPGEQSQRWYERALWECQAALAELDRIHGAALSGPAAYGTAAARPPSELDLVEARFDAAAAEVLVAFEMWRSEAQIVPSQGLHHEPEHRPCHDRVVKDHRGASGPPRRLR